MCFKTFIYFIISILVKSTLSKLNFHLKKHMKAQFYLAYFQIVFFKNHVIFQYTKTPRYCFWTKMNCVYAYVYIREYEFLQTWPNKINKYWKKYSNTQFMRTEIWNKTKSIKAQHCMWKKNKYYFNFWCL